MPSLTLAAPRSPLLDPTGRLSVLPADMPRGHASGPAAHRFLLVGGEAVAGYGVRSHELSLVGCLARSISGHTGHGTDIELVVSDRSALGHLDELLRQQTVSSLDGVVLVLGQGRLPRLKAAYGAELRNLLVSLIDRLPEGSPVTVVAAPRLTALGADAVQDAARFDSFSRTVAQAARSLAAFVELPDPGPASRSASDLYRGWATAIVGALLPNMRDPQLWRVPRRPIDEVARQRAVDRMGILDRSWEAEFERFVSFARGGYGARSASLSVIDGSRTRFMGRQGVDMRDLPREDTICASVVSAAGGVIVGDARRDPRFRFLPPVEDGVAAFYAGYRVESPDGQPVAVLCVFDPEPRPVLTQDIALLRDLAFAAQRRLWELDRAAR